MRPQLKPKKQMMYLHRRRRNVSTFNFIGMQESNNPLFYLSVWGNVYDLSATYFNRFIRVSFEMKCCIVLYYQPS